MNFASAHNDFLDPDTHIISPEGEANDIIRLLRDLLIETHEREIEDNHYGYGPDGCSYCEAIRQADEFLGDET